MQTPSAKPDFTGKWRFNAAKSALQIPAPESSRFEIDHREPDFRLTRTHVYGGQSDTVTVELTIGAAECSRQLGGVNARLRLYWEGPELVLDSTVRTPDDEGTNVVRYALRDAGGTFVAVEQWRSARHHHDNVWVFDREA